MLVRSWVGGVGEVMGGELVEEAKLSELEGREGKSLEGVKEVDG